MQENEQRRYPIPIEQSVEVLIKHLKDIKTVTSWARVMGYSRSYFSTRFKDTFSDSPSECICKIRYTQLHKIILQYPHKTSRAIAAEIGLRDEQALYKFLNRYYDTNFTEVRNKLLK